MYPTVLCLHVTNTTGEAKITINKSCCSLLYILNALYISECKVPRQVANIPRLAEQRFHKIWSLLLLGICCHFAAENQGSGWDFGDVVDVIIP